MSKFVTNISTLLNTMMDFLTEFPTRKTNIPSPILYLGTRKRAGISTVRIQADIIRKKNEASTRSDIPFVTSFRVDGGQINMDNIAEKIRIEAVVDEILENGIVEITIGADELAKSLASLSAGVPLPAKGKGIIR